MFYSKFLLVVLVCFIVSSYWLLVIVSLVVIGHCDFLGSGFMALIKRPSLSWYCVLLFHWEKQSTFMIE